jgi:hypothetical protein
MTRSKEEQRIELIASMMNNINCEISLYDMQKAEILTEMFNRCNLDELLSIAELSRRHVIELKESDHIDCNTTIVEPSVSIRYMSKKKSNIIFIVNRA